MAGTTDKPGLINGPLYKVAHFGTAYLNVPPNLHRLRNAIGLTIGLYTGRRLMDVLVGQKPDGTKIHKEDVLTVLQPLHGVLAYDHFSDDPANRWMKVFDMTMPAVLGSIGAAMGSVSFYRDSFMKPVQAQMNAAAKDYTVAHAERATLHTQSAPTAVTASNAAGFGSASGFGIIPSPLNYSATLGLLFTARAERQPVIPWLGKKWRAFLLNSHTLEPFRPTKLVGKMIDQLAGNPSLTPQNFEEVADGLLKTWFRRVTPKQMEKFKEILIKERDKIRAQSALGGKTLEETEEAVRDHLKKFLEMDKIDPAINAVPLEKRLLEAGIDPREAAIGDMGLFTTLSRWGGDLFQFGTTKKLRATQEKMIQGLEERHPELIGKPFEKPDLTAAHPAAKVVAGVLTGTGIGTIAAISSAKDIGIADLDPGNPKDVKNAGEQAIDPSCGCPLKKETGEKSFTERVGTSKGGPQKHIIHSKKHHGFINGNILDTAEGITGMFNAAIGMHRVHCAVGLTVGSWLGDEIMKAMTGVAFNGAAVEKNKIWKPLQKVYKTLAFNPHSDLPRDKWMQVLRWGVPGVIGTIAVIQSSKIFFEDRYAKLKEAKYLDDVEEKATMAQSEPWSYTSAVSGLFGFPSGLPMLPLVNYSTNLGSRFSMGSGRKVAMPVVGKIWSNNSTLFPFGPAGMTDLLIREAVNNKAHDPEMLETYAIGILKPWFDNVTPQQVESFVNQVHAIRDQYLKEGGVPEDMKKQLDSELRAHLKGAGLEETLESIGLDPLKAHIANNGLSGTIANILGAKSTVNKISADYAKSYKERLEKRKDHSSPDHSLST